MFVVSVVDGLVGESFFWLCVSLVEGMLVVVIDESFGVYVGSVVSF